MSSEKTVDVECQEGLLRRIAPLILVGAKPAGYRLGSPAAVTCFSFLPRFIVLDGVPRSSVGCASQYLNPHPNQRCPTSGEWGSRIRLHFQYSARECRRWSPMYPATPTLWIKFGILALPRPPLPWRTVYTSGRPPPVIHPTYTPRTGRSLSQLKGGPEPAQQQACESRGPPTVGTMHAE